MIKRIALAAIAAAACITPVAAEVQPGTSSLLETMEDSGILVTYNHPDCATNGANGQYRWLGFQREMRLCPGDTIDALDHNTVRHETIHANSTLRQCSSCDKYRYSYCQRRRRVQGICRRVPHS